MWSEGVNGEEQRQRTGVHIRVACLQVLHSTLADQVVVARVAACSSGTFMARTLGHKTPLLCCWLCSGVISPSAAAPAFHR